LLAGTRGGAEGDPSANAAGHCGGEKEKRPHRREKDLRLPALRFSAEMLHGVNAIRERRTLRYRHLLVRQMVQMKNKISTLVMEASVSYNKQRLHKAPVAVNDEAVEAECHQSKADTSSHQERTAFDSCGPNQSEARSRYGGRPLGESFAARGHEAAPIYCELDR
jgi:hypothetical protein